MKTKLLLSTILGVAAWSLSHVAVAGWIPGPCPPQGSPPTPCVEVVISGDTYHFNGTGDHADVWHGHPLGGDFVFSGDNVLLGCAITLDCTLELYGQVKKCQDSNGEWRIGIKVTGGDVSNGTLCNTVNLLNFPWFSKDPAIAAHCPFTDDCDNFIPYVPNAASYTGNFGAITVTALFGIPQVTEEHLHGVVFNPGNNANFDFSNKTFYDCDDPENTGCTLNGILYVQDVDELNIY